MKLDEVDRQTEIKKAGEIVQKMFGMANKAMHWDEESKPTIRGLVKQLENPFLTHITSDLDTFLHYGQKYNELDRSDIFEKYTGLPTYDDMINDPEYFARNKSTAFKIVTMYPSMYGRYTRTGFRGMDGGNFKPEEDLVFKYAKQVLDGSRMPLPYLRYELVESDRRPDYTAFGQEGRHRATVAELLGAHKIPVMVVAGLERPTDDIDKVQDFQNEIWERFK